MRLPGWLSVPLRTCRCLAFIEPALIGTTFSAFAVMVALWARAGLVSTARFSVGNFFAFEHGSIRARSSDSSANWTGVEGFVGDAILRVVQVRPTASTGHTFTAFRVIREELRRCSLGFVEVMARASSFRLVNGWLSVHIIFDVYIVIVRRPIGPNAGSG